MGVKVHKPQGGNEIVVESGGKITVKSGGEVAVEAGGKLAQQAAIADLDPGTATTADVANTVNAILAALRAAGILASS